MRLVEKKCTPCEKGTPRMAAPEIARLKAEIPGWQVVDDQNDQKLTRRFTHDDFKQAMAFVNRMADLAEAEGHHPDFDVRYSVVNVTLWTHSVGGLSVNDFILAAKIDALPGVARKG